MDADADHFLEEFGLGQHFYMRLFIAINLSNEVKESLMDIQDAMRDSGIYGRETVPENMHLTLAFIGDYDDPDYVKQIIGNVDIRPFDISLSGVGAFRDLWWVGIEENPPLQAVVRKLRRALSDADIPFDRKRFRPHITIIRKATSNLSDTLDIGLESYKGVSMRVDHISLMRSDRAKHGMIYTEL